MPNPHPNWPIPQNNSVVMEMAISPRSFENTVLLGYRLPVKIIGVVFLKDPEHPYGVYTIAGPESERWVIKIYKPAAQVPGMLPDEAATMKRILEKMK